MRCFSAMLVSAGGSPLQKRRSPPAPTATHSSRVELLDFVEMEKRAGVADRVSHFASPTRRRDAGNRVDIRDPPGPGLARHPPEQPRPSGRRRSGFPIEGIDDRAHCKSQEGGFVLVATGDDETQLFGHGLLFHVFPPPGVLPKRSTATLHTAAIIPQKSTYPSRTRTSTPGRRTPTSTSCQLPSSRVSLG